MNAVCGESRTYGVDQAKSARIARDSEEPVDPDPVPVEVDYTAEGEVTEISPDTSNICRKQIYSYQQM